ncbi:MAG: hypothetical protein GX059_03000 [Clostridiales bacterium]|jgi:hypothetical protein|nr:hypothetical protein [Clostridiales bacterium]
MNNQFYSSDYNNRHVKRFVKGDSGIMNAGFRYDKGSRRRLSDEDLVIEDNTIYEIDRECVERMKRNKKRQ